VLCFFALALLVGIGVFGLAFHFEGADLILPHGLIVHLLKPGFGLLLSVRAATQMEATQ